MSFWGYVLATFVMIQFTFAAVTLYLHRDATHRALNLHPALRHVFRFWLWMSSGMVTSEWVAVHRKHHARCETDEDPHSPMIYGIRKVLLEGAELYTQAARTPGLVAQFGRGTPDDWIERNLYRRHRAYGIVLMVLVDLVLFGVPGIIIIAVQMLAIPLFAAGVINGLGHYVGYRNFECPDAARNVVAWGILLGGEELHNNHHAFPSSAKFSICPWEFDIGWAYIQVLQALGLAQVRRVPPKLVSTPRTEVDLSTLQAVLINRMNVLRLYACEVMRPLCREHLHEARTARARATSRLLIREQLLLDTNARQELHTVLAANAPLRTVYELRERLTAMWSGASASNEAMLQQLNEWIADAEASALVPLQRFARQLRTAGIE